MEPTVIFTYFCLAMTQLWLATGYIDPKFRMLMYYLWFACSIIGVSFLVFK